MSPPMLPSVKLNAIQGSNRRITPRFYIRVLRQIVVQTVGERVHEFLQPFGAGRVLFLQLGGIDEEFHPQVLIDC